jgi:hypothetical protein
MRIDAFLADNAAIHADKLFITGANINRFIFPAGAPGPYSATFAVAGLVTVGWSETDTPHELRFQIFDEDGNPAPLVEGSGVGPEGVGGSATFTTGRPAGLSAGEDQLVPFAFNFVGLPLVRLGRYVVALFLDGVMVRRIPFALVAAEPDSASFGPASIPGL